MALPNIMMTGTLVDDVELRYTPGGRAVGSFRVATNKKRKTDAGGWEDVESCFLSCTVWERDAEACVEELARGSRVTVVGALKQRQYEHDGQKRTTYEVDVFSVAKVVKARTADRERPSEPTSDPWTTGGQGQPQNDPWASQGDQTVPF